MSPISVFFYIDALDHRMVSAEHTPFICNLADKGDYHELENIVGYSFAIQSCMLSGQYPDENLHWMPYFYSPQNSPILFKALSKVGKFTPLDKLSCARYGLLRILRKLFLERGVHPNNIPLSVIGSISLFPYYYMNELPAFYELNKVLDERYRTALIYLGPPKVKDNVYVSLSRYVKASANRKAKSILVYDDTLDRVGHAFGPFSSQYVNCVRKLDAVLAKISAKILKIDADATLLFFSDHGQSELTDCVDIVSELAKVGLKMPDDYQCFIDATIGLFWPNNGAIQERMTSFFTTLKVGTLIDDRLREKYHLKFADRKMYGDIIYILRPGWAFFPNFFSPLKPMKGLHGYLPENKVQKALIISNRAFDFDISHVRDLRRAFLRHCEFMQ